MRIVIAGLAVSLFAGCDSSSTRGAAGALAYPRAQNSLVSQVVSRDSLRDWFLQRMRHHADVWYRFERADGDDSARAKPATIDPRTLPSGKRLVRSQVSPDGQQIAYALSDGGSE